MPSIAVPARRSRSLDDEEEDDDGVSTPESHGTHSSDRRKRARLSNDRSATPVEVEDSWVLSPPNTVSRAANQRAGIPTRPARPNNAQHRAQAAVLDESGSLLQALTSGERPKHQPGAIVRVAMKNFVTYNFAEFKPGPALNMIIGPNGTGKSTLVCAICLGLGWGPKHLGRANDIGEYVKHGHSEAMIEIELQGAEGRTNTLVRRQIKKEGNKSSWYLNGNASTQKAVQNAAKSYSIQVDNLCQFLPQDRVVEFANLDSKDLLYQTQQAAAPPEVQQWHEELKTLRKDQEKEEMEQRSVKTQLDQLQARQDRQRADVQRIQERQEVEKLIEMLTKIMPFAKYKLAKVKSEQAKQKHQEKQAEATMLGEELSPLLATQKSKKEYRDAVENVVNQKDMLARKYNTMVSSKDKKFKEAGEEIEKLKTKIDSATNTDTKKTIARHQQKISRLRVLKENGRPEYDRAYYSHALRNQDRALNECNEELDTLKSSRTECKQSIHRCEQTIETTNKELSSLRTKAGQQEKKLERFEKKAAEAWKWLQNNRQHWNLKGAVYGPAIIECSVKDQVHVIGLESLLQRNDLLAFTCDSREDFDTVRKRMVEKNFHMPIRVSDMPLASFKPPVAEAEMQAIGIEGWAIDQLQGPEAVLAMLCYEAKLHTTGVASRELTESQYERLTQSPMSSCISGNKIFRINRRREYGPKAVSTTVLDAKPKHVWDEQQVDLGEEQILKQKISENTHDKEELEREHAELENKITRKQECKRDVNSEKARLEDEKSAKEKACGEYDGLDSRIASTEGELEAARKAEENNRAEIEGWKTEQREKVENRGQLALELARAVEQLRSMHQVYITTTITHIEACSDVEHMEARNEHITKQVTAAKAEASTAQSEHTRLRAEHNELRQSFKDQLDNDPPLSDYLENLPEAEKNRTPEQLGNEIEAQEARLSMLAGGDPNIIRDFEKRAKDIDGLKSKLSDAEDTLTSLEQSINSTRARYEPQIDALTAKISEAFAESFASINCAGSVSVVKPGENGRDFENWAIDIQMKFRSNEAMTSLDSQRQSGGERAVSTIFYLMALQSLSRAPFRVVDEINQGMDPRNERKVHERMVNIACGGDEFGGQTSQYFLITPKLLTGLKYSDNMTVHCIASGEYMPTDPSRVDFAKIIQEKRKNDALNTAQLVDGVGA